MTMFRNMNWDWVPLCKSIVDDRHLSQCFRTRVVGILVPSIPVLLLLCISLQRELQKRSSIAQLIATTFSTPFAQFLEMEELPEYNPAQQNTAPKWKQNTLRFLSLIQCVLWSGFCVFIALCDRSGDILYPTVNAGLWLLCILHMRSLQNAPKLVMSFMALSAMSALVDFVDSFTTENPNFYIVVIHLVRLFTNSYLTWLAGSLPLTSKLSCSFIALKQDSPRRSLCSPEDGVSLWEWITFSFVDPILDLAVKRANLSKIKELPKPTNSITSSDGLVSGIVTPASTAVASNVHDSLVGLDSNSTANNKLFIVDDENEALDDQFGPKRTLSEEDVWSLPPSFLHRNVFQKHLLERSRRPSESLTWYLLRSNSLDLIIDISVELWKATVGFVPPYALQELLKLLSVNTPSARLQAYLYAFLTFVAHLSFAQLDLFRGWHSRRCYERTRGQMFCALHHKALKRKDISGLSAENENKDMADLGKVLNLMQGDTYAVAQRFWEFSGVFAAPVRLVIALLFLYNVLGWSSLAGVIVVIVAWILNYPLAKRNIHITREFWKSKDKRMKGVNELFQNIRLLKYFGWDNRWAQNVNQTREVELGWRIKQAIVDTLISFLWSWVPSATALFAFMSYTLIEKKDLTVSKAFVSIALFDQLQAPLTALPGQVIALLNAYVSMQRIETFLAEEEVPSWATCLNIDTSEHANHTPNSGHIGFENATFQWNSINIDNDLACRSSHFMLRDLNLFFPIGQLTIVAGPTGSGKTALLNALLGELNCVSGRVHINKADHRVAYAGQSPWLEHATIRDNILYGRPFDHDRYEMILDACSLESDLAILPGGDLTEIGEKGVTLSGGQRARIALARAVYSKAECLLLDDPLAAVDMHTANHIYDKCITGKILQGRTVILVTHHISLCITKAKYLVELANGRIVRQGMVEDLRKAGKLKEIRTEERTTIIGEANNVEGDSTILNINEADQISSGVPHLRTRFKGKGKLVKAETRVEGRIKFSTYKTYLRAGGWFLWILSLALLLSLRGVVILNQLFLAEWGEAYDETSTGTHLPIVGTLPPPHTNVSPWLIIFLLLSGISAFSTLFYIGSGYYTSVRASRRLFTQMIFRLSRAPIQFFDVTPLGRIMNRFVTDFGTIDGQLNESARKTLDGILTFTSSFGVIVALVPSFLPFAVIIAYLYIRLAPSFILASRDLRRLELTSLSPTFASFDELLHGLPHVRAFAMENQYQNRFYQKIDRFQSYDHVYWLLSMWMRWRYDCLGSVVVFCASVFSLLSGIDSGYAAVIIVQAGIFAESSRQLIRVSAQLELDFNSVERISEYLIVPEEAPAILENCRPPAYWPSNTGGVQIDGLTVRYRPDLPPVLNALSFEVKPGEKVGVVGRTGSGKSTLALSFLRMVEPADGRILIDGIDISTIGLEDLRTRVTIISQDVSLFSGTIRSNLDPFDEHEDHECWDVLRRCHLVTDPSDDNAHLHAKDRSTRITNLDMPINQVGSLSAGERQLLALARAILRRSQVVIMDEATSAIDFELDSMVQKTIREELRETLVITIAHRLHTIIDYDRILVLDLGVIVEFDSPERLLSNPVGAFMQMCRKSVDWEDLRKIVGPKK